ncbi:hypothetical protein ATANTOWER_005648 [Ataeniobius toweri]|uniref:Uncharacterized protein n=1 Tax=Ataeniobius toweri TaxID=208326 RepID=A0ABU7B517_9TELE|nr:hypothetical protein [Ataeniobius toweri]
MDKNTFLGYQQIKSIKINKFRLKNIGLQMPSSVLEFLKLRVFLKLGGGVVYRGDCLDAPAQLSVGRTCAYAGPELAFGWAAILGQVFLVGGLGVGVGHILLPCLPGSGWGLVPGRPSSPPIFLFKCTLQQHPPTPHVSGRR